MFEMDKCREEFEKQRYWIGLFRDAVDFDEELGRYVLNGQRKLYAFHLDSFNEKWAIWQEAWQHQQVKVEELQEEFAEDERFLKEQIKDKDQKISNLECQQGMDKELIQALQGRSKALQDKVNDLQKQYDQHDKWLLERNRDCNELYNINAKHVAEKAELQKRVDALSKRLSEATGLVVEELEQALKGEGQ